MQRVAEPALRPIMIFFLILFFDQIVNTLMVDYTGHGFKTYKRDCKSGVLQHECWQIDHFHLSDSYCHVNMASSSQLVVGVIGNVTSLALYLSPMVTFWGIYRLKSTQEFSGNPYVFTLFNCALGLLYGSPFVKPHSTMILTINGAGFALETFYLMSFLIFTSKKQKVMTIRLTCVLMMAFIMEVAITIFVLHTSHIRQVAVGSVGVILSIVMYASPLSVLKLVIKTKSVDCMPFLLSLFNFLNALAWVAYSLVTRDLFIGVPSGIGSLLGMFQLAVYFVYRNSSLIVSPSSVIDLPETKQVDYVIVSPLSVIDLPETKQVDYVVDVEVVKKDTGKSNYVTRVASVVPTMADQV